jgi:hypothetical protein
VLAQLHMHAAGVRSLSLQLSTGRADVVIKTAWERLCWESIFPCAEYSIVL